MMMVWSCHDGGGMMAWWHDGGMMVVWLWYGRGMVGAWGGMAWDANSVRSVHPWYYHFHYD